MRFRKLRIAWSVFWGLACVLLIVLWVRSYVKWDEVDAGHVAVVSALGRLTFFGSAVVAGPYEHRSQTYPLNPLFNRGRDALLGFGAVIDRQVLSVTGPYWFPTVLVAVLAVFPWLRWKFSLRTLLIATTVVALVLGLAVWAARK